MALPTNPADLVSNLRIGASFLARSLVSRLHCLRFTGSTGLPPNLDGRLKLHLVASHWSLDGVFSNGRAWNTRMTFGSTLEFNTEDSHDHDLITTFPSIFTWHTSTAINGGTHLLHFFHLAEHAGLCTFSLRFTEKLL